MVEGKRLKELNLEEGDKVRHVGWGYEAGRPPVEGLYSYMNKHPKYNCECVLHEEGISYFNYETSDSFFVVVSRRAPHRGQARPQGVA